MSKMSAKMKKKLLQKKLETEQFFYSTEFIEIMTILNPAELKKVCRFEKEFCHHFRQQNFKKICFDE
jgi:hypothetical protein